MAQFIKGILKITYFMDSASFIKRMVTHIVVSITWANEKVQDNLIKSILLLNLTKDISNKIWNGDTECIAGTQAVFIRDFSNEIWEMDMGKCIGLKEIFIGDGGEMVYSMVKGNSLSSMKDLWKEFLTTIILLF